jgi:DNA-binding transcriptional LysR family regulator
MRDAGRSFFVEELAMTEFVEVKSQMAVVTLAEELNYARASEKLNITQPELNRQITELENQLGLHVFRVIGDAVEVTEDGQVFVSACRTFLATRSGQGDKSKIQD